MSNLKKKKQNSYTTFCCIDVVVIPLIRFDSVMMGITEYFSDILSSFGRIQGILGEKWNIKGEHFSR